MSAGLSSEEPTPELASEPDVTTLLPMVRRIVLARVGGQPADDLVQEALVRVLAALPRIEPGMLEPYAIVTARNVIATMWHDDGRRQRNQHRVVDLVPPEAPDEKLLATEKQAAVSEALARLSERERETLLAHEVAGQDTRTLATCTGSTSGAVAAQLNRTRARLRVEYLLRSSRPSPRPTGAGRSWSLSPAATGAVSVRSTRPATCSSASSAPGSANRRPVTPDVPAPPGYASPLEEAPGLAELDGGGRDGD